MQSFKINFKKIFSSVGMLAFLTLGLVTQVFAAISYTGVTNLPNLQRGVPYSLNPFTGNVSGETSPYSYALAPTSAAFPVGVSISSAGLISGTPSCSIANGSFTPTVRITDSTSGTPKTLDVTLHLNMNGPPSSSCTSPGGAGGGAGNSTPPPQDPGIATIQNSQLLASYRLGLAQINNAFSRIEGARFSECLRSSFNLSTNLPAQQNTQSSQGSGATSSQTNANTGNTDRKLGDDLCSEYAVWISGEVGYGHTASAGSLSGSKFTTPGITVGVDKRVLSRTIVGVALGVGSDRTTLSDESATSKGTFSNVMFYGSTNLIDKVYLDGLIGYGSISYSSSRAMEGLLATGDRNASQVFSSLRLSGTYPVAKFKFTPYARFDLGNVKLRSYSESGDASITMNYAASSFRYNNTTLGLKSAYPYKGISGGTLEPFVRFEQQYAGSNTVNQSMTYVDTAANDSTFTLQSTPLSNKAFLSGIGLSYTAKNGVLGQIEYNYLSGRGGYQQNTFRLMFKYPFN